MKSVRRERCVPDVYGVGFEKKKSFEVGKEE